MKRENTPRQQKYIENYLNPNSDTYGNGVQSVIKAGYTGNYDSACQRANRLRKAKVSEIMEEMKEDFKLDIQYYLKDLDTKLRAGGKDTKISREWLLGLRTALETENRIGAAGSTQVQVNFAAGKADLTRLGIFDLQRMAEQIESILKEKMSNPIMQTLKTVISKPVEAIEAQIN